MKTHVMLSLPRRLLTGSAAVALLSGWTSGALAREAKPELELNDGFEQVQSFSVYGRLRDFDALDRNRLIVWTSSSRPYLIELAAPSVDLRFAHAIGIRSRTNRVYAGFDSVIIAGHSYPIRRIYKLSREEADFLDQQAAAARAS